MELIIGAILWMNSAFSDINRTGAFSALILTAITIFYALETHRYRRSADSQLKFLRDQHNRNYESYIVISGIHHYNGDIPIIELLNIGPGPALLVKVRAIVYVRKERRCFSTTIGGMLVGGKVQFPELQEEFDPEMNTAPFPDFPGYDCLPENITIEITSYTVFNQEMEPQYRVALNILS